MSGHYSVLMMLGIKQMSLEPLYITVPGLTYIPGIAKNACMAINKITASILFECYHFVGPVVVIH